VVLGNMPAITSAWKNADQGKIMKTLKLYLSLLMLPSHRGAWWVAQ